MPKNWCFQSGAGEDSRERVSWTARRSNQSILKEIDPAYSLEGLMYKLKLQYFGQSWLFIGRTDVEAETPVLWPPDAKS